MLLLSLYEVFLYIQVSEFIIMILLQKRILYECKIVGIVKVI